MNNTKINLAADQPVGLEEVNQTELEAVTGGFFFLVVAGALAAGGAAGALANSPARDTLRALRR